MCECTQAGKPGPVEQDSSWVRKEPRSFFPCDRNQGRSVFGSEESEIFVFPKSQRRGLEPRCNEALRMFSYYCCCCSPLGSRSQKSELFSTFHLVRTAMAIVPMGPCRITGTMEVYDYLNASLPYHAMIHLLDDGTISYSSWGVTTGWHGKWQRETEWSLVLRFNYEGDATRLKTARLVRTADNRWSGFDYAGRDITMVHRRTNRFCAFHNQWHI